MGVIEARRRILLSAPHVETTTSAGVANFQTDLISPLKSLKAGFLPVQSGSGDPSPSNVRPISGWSGLTLYKASENLFDSSVPTVPGRLASDGTIEANNNYVTTDFIPIDSGNYTFCVCSSYDGSGTIATRIFAYDSNKEAIGHSLWQLRTSDDKYYTATFIIGTAKYIKLSYRITDFDIAIYSTNSITTIPVTFPAAGKNLFDEANAQGYAKYINVTTPPEWKNSSDSLSYVMKAQPNTTYSAKANNPDITIFKVAILDKSPDTVGNTAELVRAYQPVGYQTFTTPDKECWIVLQYNKVIAEARTGQIQVELGSTATSYEPYRNAYYGGYVDLVRGEVVAEWEIASARWGDIKGASPHAETGMYTGIMNFAHVVASVHYQSDYGKAICNYTKNVIWSGNSVTPEHFFISTSSGSVYSYTSMSFGGDFGDDNVVQVCAQLATPITYPLTPQIIKSLRGTNNVWSDANGDMSVEYWKH